MRQLIRLATAFAAGAFAMYMLDPQTGRRRRALVRDKAMAAGHDAQRLARGVSKHTADHLRGAAAEMRAHMRDAPLSDRQLHERIRSELGRWVGRSGSVDVNVKNGHVTLSGSVRPSEMEELIAAISGMRGVESIENRLTTGQGASQVTQGPPAGQKPH